MLGQHNGMRTVFLGHENKKLDSYKEEMKKIRICIVCGSEIVENGSYGELGYIVRRKIGKWSSWYYEFTKLCPNCFGEVNAVLRRIRRESTREEAKR